MKRLYHILALLALIHLFALAGFVGYLFLSGRLNSGKIEQIALVMRGQSPTSQPATQPSAPAAAPQPSVQPTLAQMQRVEAEKEFFALVAQRHQREMDDRRALNEKMQLDIMKKLEELERGKQELKEQQKKLQEQSEQEGFSRILEMFENMEPQIAKNLLRNQTKEADAVQLLMGMDTGRARKIINACKTPEEQLWIGRILNQINNLNKLPGGGVDGPQPTSRGG